MKRPLALVGGVLATFVLVGPVSAGPSIGTTSVPPTQPSGTVMPVVASVTSPNPVVPYEYAIQNECSLPDRGGSTYQRDDIVTWTDVQSGHPTVTMPIDLTNVPTGSKCKVFLIKNNTVVKGSTSSYVVD